jgi:hypothetical protein
VLILGTVGTMGIGLPELRLRQIGYRLSLEDTDISYLSMWRPG